MAEPGQSEQQKAPSENPCIPVTKKAVDNALTSIAKDANRAMDNEETVMKTENPMLYLGFRNFMNLYKQIDQNNAMEGATYTYRILREQASISVKSVPKVTSDIWKTFLRDMIERLEKGSSVGEASETYNEKIKEITEQDHEFGQALRELTKYRAGKNHFNFGALCVYMPIKHAQEAEAMNQHLQK
ncbi:MAG: hypothetical protein V1697_03370 [Candidatus Levyibacteriota bacterium]